MTNIDRVKLNSLSYFTALENLFTARSEVWFHSNHTSDKAFQIARVLTRRIVVVTFNNSFEKIIHVLCPKRWVKSKCLIQDASKRPDVTLAIVWFVVPDFGTGIVRSSCLCVKEPCFGYLGYIHIPQTRCAVPVKEHVSRLYITMEDAKLM